MRGGGDAGARWQWNDRPVPNSVAGLLSLLELERLEVDLFRGRQPDTSRQRVFGGQVAAQALAAASQTVPPEVSAHSLHAYFLRPGDTAIPIVYDVERIRDGRSFATRRVVARQHGTSIFFLTASFHLTEIGYDHQDVMPDVPPPEDCPTMGDLFRKVTGRPEDRSWEREWAALDVRYAGDSRPGGGIAGGAEPARARIWLKASDEVPADPMVHTCVLAYASDLTLLGVSLVPHGVLIVSPQIQPASLDHSMWFHRPFRADEWLLYDQHSPSASRGPRVRPSARSSAADGRLVASVAQEGLIRPLGEAREGAVVRYGFAIDHRTCIGCHACTVACKTEHQIPVGQFRTWVKYVDSGTFPDSTRDFGVHALQPLHRRAMRRDLPDELALQARRRHRRLRQRDLHRLQVVHAGLPVRRHLHRQGHQHRRQVQLLRAPGRQRARARVRDRLPDALDLGRRPRGPGQWHQPAAGVDGDGGPCARAADRPQRALRRRERPRARPARGTGPRHLHLGPARRPPPADGRGPVRRRPRPPRPR